MYKICWKKAMPETPQEDICGCKIKTFKSIPMGIGCVFKDTDPPKIVILDESHSFKATPEQVALQAIVTMLEAPDSNRRVDTILNLVHGIARKALVNGS